MCGGGPLGHPKRLGKVMSLANISFEGGFLTDLPRGTLGKDNRVGNVTCHSVHALTND